MFGDGNAGRVSDLWLIALLIVASAVLIAASQPPRSQKARTGGSPQHSSHEAGAGRTQPPSQAHEDRENPIFIVHPANAAIVGACVTVRLSGRVPPGEALVVAHQLRQPWWYFKPARFETSSNLWSDPLAIGQRRIPKGIHVQTLTIDAILMPKWLANYLMTMQRYQEKTNTYWVSSSFPPSALKVSQITVARSRRKGPASCPS
jgi:hypothetical protein